MLRPLFETSQDHNTSLSGGILVHYLFQRPRARSVMGTGGVERFFLFFQVYSDERHGLHDNGRRLAFMTQYNGDLEGPLD